MLDIMMPVSLEDLASTVVETHELDQSGQDIVVYDGAIPRLERFTDVPFRLVVCVDGGTREDVEFLKAYLPISTCEWALMQNNGVQGFAYTMSELVRATQKEFVAFVPANIWVDDDKWFGKMQVVFTKDPHCFMVAGDVPNTASTMVPPVKLTHSQHPRSDFFLSRQAAIQNVVRFTGAKDFSEQAHQLGGTRWVAPGVHYLDTHARKDDRKLESSQSRDS